jgi:hypothetical protein
LSVAADGSVWVGEYGVYPGARGARAYVSRDDGRSFREVAHVRSARHVHLVKCLRDGRILVTTGDLLAEQGLYVIEGKKIRRPQSSWCGFTAAVETSAGVAFGTDLERGNGIALLTGSLGGPPTFVAFPPWLDLQVRSLDALEDGRLVALGSMDADLAARRDGLRPCVLLSADSGQTWTVTHEFEPDWSDAPESLVRISGASFLTTISSGPLLPHSRSTVVEIASRPAPVACR